VLPTQTNACMPVPASSLHAVADLKTVLVFLVQFLVHVLAALALMGLGCLWQLMNASANFAHARRDMREAPGRSDPAQFLTGVSHCMYGQAIQAYSCAVMLHLVAVHLRVRSCLADLLSQKLLQLQVAWVAELTALRVPFVYSLTCCRMPLQQCTHLLTHPARRQPPAASSATRCAHCSAA
jgi:hypothetical protein